MKAMRLNSTGTQELGEGKVSSANFAERVSSAKTTGITQEDRIALLNKANNGGRPVARGMSAGTYNRPPAAVQGSNVASANYFYGNNNQQNPATQQA